MVDERRNGAVSQIEPPVENESVANQLPVEPAEKVDQSIETGILNSAPFLRFFKHFNHLKLNLNINDLDQIEQSWIQTESEEINLSRFDNLPLTQIEAELTAAQERIGSSQSSKKELVRKTEIILKELSGKTLILPDDLDTLRQNIESALALRQLFIENTAIIQREILSYSHLYQYYKQRLLSENKFEDIGSLENEAFILKGKIRSFNTPFARWRNRKIIQDITGELDNINAVKTNISRFMPKADHQEGASLEESRSQLGHISALLEVAVCESFIKIKTFLNKKHEELKRQFNERIITPIYTEDDAKGLARQITEYFVKPRIEQFKTDTEQSRENAYYEKITYDNVLEYLSSNTDDLLNRVSDIITNDFILRLNGGNFGYQSRFNQFDDIEQVNYSLYNIIIQEVQRNWPEHITESCWLLNTADLFSDDAILSRVEQELEEAAKETRYHSFGDHFFHSQGYFASTQGNPLARVKETYESNETQSLIDASLKEEDHPTVLGSVLRISKPKAEILKKNRWARELRPTDRYKQVQF